MKRLIGITTVFTISVFVLWAFSQVSLLTTSKAKSDNMPNQVHTLKDNTVLLAHSREETIPVTGSAMKVAPVFNTTGAVISDPTGTLLSAVHSRNVAVPTTAAAMKKVAPVYDATGVLVSDPTGTISNTANP
jgi:hypothetical protein